MLENRISIESSPVDRFVIHAHTKKSKSGFQVQKIRIFDIQTM